MFFLRDVLSNDCTKVSWGSSSESTGIAVGGPFAFVRLFKLRILLLRLTSSATIQQHQGWSLVHRLSVH